MGAFTLLPVRRDWACHRAAWQAVRVACRQALQELRARLAALQGRQGLRALLLRQQGLQEPRWLPAQQALPVPPLWGRRDWVCHQAESEPVAELLRRPWVRRARAGRQAAWQALCALQARLPRWREQLSVPRKPERSVRSWLPELQTGLLQALRELPHRLWDRRDWAS